MKKILKVSTCLLLLLATLALLIGCAPKPTGLWADATYTKDTTLGSGKTTVSVAIVCEDKTVTLTVKTDKDNLGAALYELEIINDPSFFDTVNGIKADWDADKAYWGFYIGEEYAMHGASDEKITNGGVYKLVYTK